MADTRFLRDDKWQSKAQVDVGTREREKKKNGKKRRRAGEEVNNGAA